jgi:hypothetical protein
MIWFLNGFYCKLLNQVPRHQLIVARILGAQHSFLFTKLIGVLEILMSVWVFSQFKSSFCTLTQVVLILTMNMIEYFKARDLLLFGRVNILLAVLLIGLIFYSPYA